MCRYEDYVILSSMKTFLQRSFFSVLVLALSALPLPSNAANILIFEGSEGGSVSIEISPSTLSFYAENQEGERIEDHYLLIERVSITEFFGLADREFMIAMTESEIVSGEIFVIDYTDSTDNEPLYWGLLRDENGRNHLFHLEEDEESEGSWIFYYQGVDSELISCTSFLKGSTTIH